MIEMSAIIVHGYIYFIFNIDDSSDLLELRFEEYTKYIKNMFDFRQYS